MRIHVRFAEPFWRTVGQRDLELEIEQDAVVADLLDVLRQRYPTLAQEMKETSPHIFVGEDEASDETQLEEDSYVHLVWAVAGG